MFSYLKEKLLNSKDKNKGLPKVDSLGLIFQEPPKKQKNAFRTRPVFYRFTSLRFSIRKLYPESESGSISLFFILKCKFRSATICQSFQFFVRWKITFFSVMLDGPVPRFLSVYFQHRLIDQAYILFSFSGSRKSGLGGTTRRCWNMKSSSWAVTTMSAESKHRKWPRVREIFLYI